MRNVRLLPIQKDKKRYLLRMEAMKDDGTAIFAEGELERPHGFPFNTQGKAHSVLPDTLDEDEFLQVLQQNVQNLLFTLHAVAGELEEVRR